MCSAFLEVRLFTGVYPAKWAMMGLSHSHGFASFPGRVPRSTFSEQTLERFEEMARQNKSSAEIAMANDVFCNKHIFPNTMRPFRDEKRADQAREIRDAARSSDLWNSEIHLANDNVFEAMFFVNRQLIAKGVQIDVVYVDDTSCTGPLQFRKFTIPQLLVSIPYLLFDSRWFSTFGPSTFFAIREVSIHDSSPES